MAGNGTNDPQAAVLTGLTFLVLASAAKAAPFCRKLEEMGARAIRLPAIELRAIEPNRERDIAAGQLAEFDWVIFTSANAVRYFLESTAGVLPTRKAASKPLVCAVGPATGAELHARGWDVDLVPRKYSAEGVIESVTRLAGEAGRLSGLRVLIPGAKARRDVLEQQFGRAGADVTAVAVYENVIPETDPAVLDGIRANPPGAIVFTSPSTVRNFVALLGEEAALRMMRSSLLAALGPVTAAEVRATCREPDLVPGANTLSALVDALVQRFSRPD